MSGVASVAAHKRLPDRVAAFRIVWNLLRQARLRQS
jgi:hypothetical protein